MKSTYHDDPCGSHGPRQTQQKSDLQDWFLHTMWLQPPSFSIVAPKIELNENQINNLISKDKR